MLRRAHPYTDNQHDLNANEALLAYQKKTRWVRQLPVPVDKIIEAVYGLQLETVVIEEGPGEHILGRLVIETKTIELNETHLEPGGILEKQGPLNFTYAHELGHWIYDAGNPDQGSFAFDEAPQTVLCRHVDTPPTSRNRTAAELREVNANKFAARLLLPADLVNAAMRDPGREPLWRCAREWGVSKTALRIRLADLGWETEEL